MLACLAAVCCHCQWQHLNKIDFPFWPIKLFTQNDNCPHLSSSSLALPLDFVSRRIRRPGAYVCVCVPLSVSVCVFVLCGTWGINKNLLINVQFNFVLLLISGLGAASLAASSALLLLSLPLSLLLSPQFANSHMDFISFMCSFLLPLLALFFSCLCLDSVLVLPRLGHFSHFGGFFLMLRNHDMAENGHICAS